MVLYKERSFITNAMLVFCLAVQAMTRVWKVYYLRKTGMFRSATLPPPSQAKPSTDC